MLMNSQPIRIGTFTPFGKGTPDSPVYDGGALRSGPAHSESRRPGTRGRSPLSFHPQPWTWRRISRSRAAGRSGAAWAPN